MGNNRELDTHQRINSELLTRVRVLVLTKKVKVTAKQFIEDVIRKEVEKIENE